MAYKFKGKIDQIDLDCHSGHLIDRLNGGTGILLDARPEEITDEVMKKAVMMYPISLRYIPKKLLTEEVCLLAIETMRKTNFVESSPHYNILGDIPEHLRTERVCVEAIELGQPDTFRELSDGLKTKLVCETAMKVSALNFAYFPHSQKTLELCIMAVEAAPDLMNLVPVELLRNEQTCEQLITRNDKANSRLLMNFQSESIIEKITDVSSVRYDLIEDEYKSNNLAKKILNKNPLMIFSFKESELTEELVGLALTKNLKSINYLKQKDIEKYLPVFRDKYIEALNRTIEPIFYKTKETMINADNSLIEYLTDYSEFVEIAESLGIEVEIPEIAQKSISSGDDPELPQFP